MSGRPAFVAHWTELEGPDDSRYPGDEELMSIGAPLGRKLGLTRVGIHHERLPPGRRTSYPHAESAEEESFARGLLEYPHYTRPAEWQGRGVPEVLLSGHHAAVARWRQAEAERITRERRPDLWSAHLRGGHSPEMTAAPVVSRRAAS